MFSKLPIPITFAFTVLALLCGPGSDCVAAGKVSLTVYNQDLAFVRDRREVSLKKGVNEISFVNVPSSIDPTSVRVLFLDEGAGAQVLTQSYRYDVAGMDRLLDIGLGEEVSVRTEGGELFRGDLIGYDGGSLIVRELSDAVRKESEAVIAVRREKVTDIRFPDLGKDLVVRPTLMWRMEAARNAPVEIEASYLTSGMSWHTEYVASIGREDGPMELSAWASIDNRSGAGFEDAALTLVAGTVHRAAARGPRRMEMMTAAGAPPAFEEEELFEYHAYTLSTPLTIGNNESVQLALFSPADVLVDRTYTYDPTRFSGGVKVTAKTENTEARGLGRPMPKGKIRVYAGDGGAEPRLVGEDMLLDTAVGSEIELFLGVAFDIKGKRVRTAYTRHSRNDYEESYEITLRNSKPEPVQVLVIEHPRGDWTITEASHDFEEKDSNTVQWNLTVPPAGEASISYTIQFRS